MQLQLSYLCSILQDFRIIATLVQVSPSHPVVVISALKILAIANVHVCMLPQFPHMIGV